MTAGIKANADGSAAIQVGGSDAITISTAGVIGFNSGYGSVATAYGCRAWVNFNGTGTVAIRASGNVSSITDNGTGIYTVNFITAMPDANFTAVAAQSTDGYATRVDSYGVTVVRVVTFAGVAFADSATVSVAIFR